MYRPVYRLVNAGWIKLTEAKTSLSLLDIWMAAEALEAWEEARAIADATPPPKTS